ncbi:MAG: hypothetical protein ACOCVG_00820 [Verrucomicrobiota bacterium]
MEKKEASSPPKKSKKGLPMRWVVAAIVIYIAVYNFLLLLDACRAP